MTVTDELSEICGDLILGGFPGTSLDDRTKRALAERRQAGVILFKRNVESVPAVHELTREVLEATTSEYGAFVAVDQEGGRVKRLPEPCIQLPPMRFLGGVGHDGLVRRAAVAVGAELFALGINLNFAPVLDVDSNPANPVIGDRAFSDNPDVVAALGNAFAQGLQSRGVLACAKHFPGHGDTTEDSHLALPIVRHSRERLEQIELLPFRRTVRTIGSFMTAHVVFEALDPALPATLSKVVIQDFLRREMGYHGVIFSDDLEMRALADRYTVEESAVMAIRAGCDVLLICEKAEWIERAHAALLEEARKDDAFRARCIEASNSSRAARRRFPIRRALTAAALQKAFDDSGAMGVMAELRGRSQPPGPL
jgi:beta-N-acetylhexosaminidase